MKQWLIPLASSKAAKVTIKSTELKDVLTVEAEIETDVTLGGYKSTLVVVVLVVVLMVVMVEAVVDDSDAIVSIDVAAVEKVVDVMLVVKVVADNDVAPIDVAVIE